MTAQPTSKHYSEFTNKHGVTFQRGDIVSIPKNPSWKWGIYYFKSDGSGMACVRTTPQPMWGGMSCFSEDVHVDDMTFIEHGKVIW